MLSRFSVNKPYTVVVAVIVVIMLGVIAFFNMTTDLLPSFDLPYLVVVTSYPGATPEEVEQTVTKPLEQTLATTSNVKNITSTSSENYAMVMLEFYNDVNMDSTIIEMNGSIDMLEASWPDDVGAPMIIKLNPDAMPIMVAAVDSDGMDMEQISTLTEDIVMPALETIDGVASVDAEGLYEVDIKVSLDEVKIEELNQKITDEIDKQMQEAEGALEEAQQKLDEGADTLSEQTRTQTEQVEKASAELTSGKVALAQSEGQLTSAEQQLLMMRGSLEDAQAELNKQIATLEQQKAELEQKIASGNVTPIPTVPVMPSALPTALPTTLPIPTPVPTAAPTASAGLLEFDSQEEAELARVNAALEPLLDTQAETQNSMNDIDAQLAEIQAGKGAIDAGKSQLAQGEAQLAQGKGMLTQGLNDATIELAAGKAILQIKMDEFDAAKENADNQAEMTAMITPAMISQLLYAQNFSMPAGYIVEDGRDYIVKVGEEIHSVEELCELVIFDTGMDEIGEIRLKDVAEVDEENNADDVYAKINGNQGIVLTMQKQSMYSTADVSEKINQRIVELEEENPGLHITKLMDQGIYISIVVDNVLNNLLYGAILAVIVLLLFLRNIKPTLVVATSIPISVVFALVLMYFSGVTLNVISLAGLALGVGMLVDNSIVVIENIFRLRALGASARKAAIEGAKQVSGAIIASTLTTVCVFLPIVFVQGISRQLFADMGLTIAYSLLASLLVALTLVPSMSAAMLKGDQGKEQKKHRMDGKIRDAYGKMLGWSLKHKAVILIPVFVLFGWCVYNVFSMGVVFMPSMDGTEITVSMQMPPEHNTFEETTAMADEVTDRILEVPGVETVGAMEGGMNLFGGGGDSGMATMYVLLDEDKDQTAEQIADQIRQQTDDLDCDLSVSAQMMDISAFSGEGVQVVIKGQDLNEMSDIATDIADMLRETEGTVDVSDGLEESMPELRIVVNKDKAMEYNLTVAQVYSSVSSLVSSGSTATQIDIENFEYPVIVVDGAREQATREDLMNMTITSESYDGTYNEVELKEIAEIVETSSLASIRRDNQERYITVSAMVDSAHNVGLVARDFQTKLDAYDVPDGYTVTVEGENTTIMDALDDLIYMLLLAVALVYLIMVAQFQSLKSPFIVMFTIPLAFTGGLLALLIFGFEISVIAMLGFLILAGIIVNNGIVFVDYVNQLRLGGMEKREALVEAGKTRLRPIMMTALTTILGLTTLAMGIGTGADMLQPMAVVTIGGLIYGTLLTLFVVPCLYDVFNKGKMRHPELDDEEEKELLLTEDDNEPQAE